jgi:hypothetical protein
MSKVKRLYGLLIRYGDEEQAVDIAKRQFERLGSSCKECSEMYPCTAVFPLIEEIKSKCHSE